MAIRKSEGSPPGRFEAHVKYEADEHEQWEVIGADPYHHKLVSEPSRQWLDTGNSYIGAQAMFKHRGKLISGVVMCWLPKVDEDDTDENEVDLYKVYHQDGDYGDLDLAELEQAIQLFEKVGESSSDVSSSDSSSEFLEG